MKGFARWIPLLVILIVFGLAIHFKLYRYITFETLKTHHVQLQQWTSQNYWLVVFIYIAFYIVAVTFSFPGALFITVTGGFLFGPYLGTLYVVISATIGASLLFLAVRTSLGDWLASKASGWVAKLEKGFQENAFSYLLTLRLIPAFPFFIVNVVPALLEMRLAPYALATFIGIIPGAFVYASLGNGLVAIIDTGKTPDFGIIFNPEIFLPLLGLAILSIVPTIYKKIKAKKRA